MCEYKFYPIRDDGHIKAPAISQDLPDDFAALREAKKLIDGCDIEVWQEARLVGYVIPEDQ